MLELYHSGLTTCSKQVRHCLREKGLTYTSRYVELWRYENLSPDYLKLNPNGVVPTLVHDGVPVINPSASMNTSTTRFPIRRCGRRTCTSAPACATGPGPRTRFTWRWRGHPRQDAAGGRRQPERARQADHAAATPVPEKRDRWRVLTRGGYSDDQLQTALDNVLFVLGRVRKSLGAGRGWPARRFLWPHPHAGHRAPHLWTLCERD